MVVPGEDVLDAQPQERRRTFCRYELAPAASNLAPGRPASSTASCVALPLLTLIRCRWLGWVTAASVDVTSMVVTSLGNR